MTIGGATSGSANRKTFLEGVSQIMGQVGQLMGLPDADPGFCQALLQAMSKRVQQAAPGVLPQDGVGMGASGPRSPEGTPGPMGPPPMGVQPGYQIPPEAVAMLGGAGGAPGGAPNPDELRRVLTPQ